MTAGSTTAGSTTAGPTAGPTTAGSATAGAGTGGRQVQVRPGAYHDSVTLMRVSRDLARQPGVRAAQVAMATPLNLEVLTGMGFAVPADAGPADLVVAVDAADADTLSAALDALETLLNARPGGSTGAAQEQPAHTVGAALRRADADLVLVSVPGSGAFAEALDAVRAGRSVMVFSDNVPLEQEVRLKAEAARAGVLVMGPDCGTAVVGGIGLGFANVVDDGPVSLVAASGTGAQQLMCLLDAAGVGVRHCLGVGGRDLSAAVGGASTRQAIAALSADPGTSLVVVVSKPPAPQVLHALEQEAERAGTPVAWAALGPGRPDLSEVARDVLALAGHAAPQAWPQWAPQRPLVAAPGLALRGLFCGGTLCDEAMLIAAAELTGGAAQPRAVLSNIPLRPEWALTVDGTANWDAGSGHAMVDFGDDALTRGRAHPMIDPSLRLARLVREAADPRVGALLLDVVLGHGSHPDPAADLAPAIAKALAEREAAGRPLGVVVSLTGSRGDPQGRDAQATALATAGAHVHLSNADAARHAVSLVKEVRA